MKSPAFITVDVCLRVMLLLFLWPVQVKSRILCVCFLNFFFAVLAILARPEQGGNSLTKHVHNDASDLRLVVGGRGGRVPVTRQGHPPCDPETLSRTCCVFDNVSCDNRHVRYTLCHFSIYTSFISSCPALPTFETHWLLKPDHAAKRTKELWQSEPSVPG